MCAFIATSIKCENSFDSAKPTGFQIRLSNKWYLILFFLKEVWKKWNMNGLFQLNRFRFSKKKKKNKTWSKAHDSCRQVNHQLKQTNKNLFNVLSFEIRYVFFIQQKITHFNKIFNTFAMLLVVSCLCASVFVLFSIHFQVCHNVWFSWSGVLPFSFHFCGNYSFPVMFQYD